MIFKTKSLVSGLLLACPQLVWAQAVDPGGGDNFRDRCRKTVASAYAEAWNESHRAADSVQLTQNSLKKLRPLLAQVEQNLKEHQKKMQGASFSSANIERRDQLVAKERVLHEQIDSAVDILEKAQKSRHEAISTHKNLAAHIDTVFQRKFAADPEGRPRKIFHQLEWRSPCPKFRTLCALPPPDALNLKNLLKVIKDYDDNCKKYASLK